MELSEFEKKRAANLIWNGAQNYQVDPGFRVYDEDGRADIYWNSIVGAIHLHYDWKKLEDFYNTFHEKIDQTSYESLFWLALENATFEKEKNLRPVFPYLRKQYARKKLEQMQGAIAIEDSVGQRVLGITKGHFRHALGEDCGLPDMVDRKLLDEIELGPDLNTDEIIDHLANTLEKYFTYRRPGSTKPVPKEQKYTPFHLFFLRKRKGKAQNLGPVRHLSFGYGEHVKEYGSEVLDQSHISVAFAKYTGQTDEGLREYITDYFGKPMYDRKTLRDLEKKYCNGNHADVRLHITRGEYTEDMLKHGYAGKMRQEALEQRKKNEQAYQDRYPEYHSAIQKLTQRIRNSMLVHLDDQVVKASAGTLNAGRIWRALELGDDRVFDKVIPGDNGNLTVDILLDASTSQVHRQEKVAAQGYMIAEALTACNIPVKVYSFCSINGYTVINLFRDYQENDKNREIFNYFSSGANRDGLAIRIAAGQMKKNHADHRILIVLSDCKPNDVIKVRSTSGSYRDYAGDMGVEDTAEEVHQAKMQGIAVMCVFTGEDASLPSVHRIYGRDFVRIRSLDMFGDAVGSLLQNHIRFL